MKKRVKLISAGHLADQAGQALILVLVFLLLGSLILVPVLAHIATALKTGRAYEVKTDELYTADAGIEEGIWRIKYDELGPTYNIYDFSTNWSYQTDNVNGMKADEIIQNIWIPTDVTLSALGITPAQAKTMVESEKLVVTGTSGAVPGQPYHIKIDFTPASGDNLTIKSIGIWLPRGFTYNTGFSNLEKDGPFPDSVDISAVPGGQAVVWRYWPYPLFTSFPNVNSEATIMTADITFDYTPPADRLNELPVAIAWVTTEMHDSLGNPKPHPNSPENVPIAWDTDTRIYKITSTAGNTSIEAYSSKCELRKMGDAAAGDYVAIGNSLMTDDFAEWGGVHHIKDTWHSDSTIQLSSIPADADVTAAYLYWSGWMYTISKFSDSCSSNNLTYSWSQNSTTWSIGSSWGNDYYQGHYSGNVTNYRYLTMKNKLNLSSYPSGQVIVSWKQSVTGSGIGPGDGLDFSFSSDNGSTWSSNIQAFRGNLTSSQENYYYIVPGQYLTSNFKLRFYLVGMGSTGQYCNLDDIRIDYLPPDTSVMFKINDVQYSLSSNGTPQVGGEVTAGNAQVFPNFFGGSLYGFSYACHRNVTVLVQKYPEDGKPHHTGNAKYTVGGVGVPADTGTDLSYAGWSLIIVYSSPATAGHYLYLRDVFSFNPGTSVNLDFDGDGQPGGDITNFIIPEPIKNNDGVITETVAARLTCFVGEGDDWRTGDYVKITGQQSEASEYLANSKSPWNNVWNGKSPDLTLDGIDIDTFQVLWNDGILIPNDKKLHVDMYSGDWDGYSNSGDAFNLIYIILSVRSKTVTSGTNFYVIK